jgi:hypothetical protein
MGGGVVKNRIEWSSVMIIAKLKEGEIFSFLQRRQSTLKGRVFKFLKREGKICFYSEKDSTKILECNWNRDIIKLCE